jgi:uncharacterized membrane protein
MKIRVCRTVAVVAGLTVAPAALATPALQQQFEKIGQPAAGSALVQAQCTACHIRTPKLNPFGLDLKAEMGKGGSQSLTPELWQALGLLDSDRDGASNQAEVAAGTLPGTHESKPAAAAQEPPTTPEKTESELAHILNPSNAFHPIVVHFPIALFFTSLALDLLGMLRRDKALMVAGFYNLAFSAAGALFSLVTGFVAMRRLQFPFQGDTRNHVILAVLTTILLIVLYAIRVRRHEQMSAAARIVYLVVGLAGVVALGIAGHYGGKMVYGE